MFIDKDKLINKKWESVSNYLKKDNDDSIKLAIIEAENIFLDVVNSKGYKKKKIDDKIASAVMEIKRSETFLKAREKALIIKNKPREDISDIYSGREIVDTYKEAIEDILFGIINEKKMSSLKYRFWDFYYTFFINRFKIFKYLIALFVIVGIMLFIADTNIGKNTFEFLIEKIHFILRLVLLIVFLLFSAVFFVVFSIIILESRTKKKSQKLK